MSTDINPVGDTEIRIAIEIGDNAQTTQRIKDAITELADALAEADADDVSGFALTSLKGGAFLYDSRVGAPSLTLGYTELANKSVPVASPYVTGGSDGKWP